MYVGSTLIWFFTGEKYSPLIKTSYELINSGMELGVDERTANYFKDQLSEKEMTEIEQKITDRLIFCNSTNVCLSRIARDRYVLMCMHKLLIQK